MKEDVRTKHYIFKSGDRVETPLGIGTIKSTGGDDESYLKSEVLLDKYNKEYLEFDNSELKPYKSAREKLISLGYNNSGSYHIWKKDTSANSRIFLEFFDILEEKTYVLYAWSLHTDEIYGPSMHADMAKIISQYIEEM